MAILNTPPFTDWLQQNYFAQSYVSKSESQIPSSGLQALDTEMDMAQHLQNECNPPLPEPARRNHSGDLWGEKQASSVKSLKQIVLLHLNPFSEGGYNTPFFYSSALIFQLSKSKKIISTEKFHVAAGMPLKMESLKKLKPQIFICVSPRSALSTRKIKRLEPLVPLCHIFYDIWNS